MGFSTFQAPLLHGHPERSVTESKELAELPAMAVVRSRGPSTPLHSAQDDREIAYQSLATLEGRRRNQQRESGARFLIRDALGIARCATEKGRHHRVIASDFSTQFREIDGCSFNVVLGQRCRK